MFCSVCLAFSVETNPFICGMTDWKHIYQRITEHENTKSHIQCCDAYFMHCHQKDIGSLLNSNQINLHREEVKKNLRKGRIINTNGGDPRWFIAPGPIHPCVFLYVLSQRV